MQSPQTDRPSRRRGRLRYVPAPLRPWVQRFVDPLRELASRAGRVVRRLGRPSHWRSTGRFLAALGRAGRQRRRETRLTVAVDAAPLWDSMTGVGWYLYSLLTALAERQDLVLRLYGPAFGRTGDTATPARELPRGAAIELVSWDVPDDLLLPAGMAARLLRWSAPLLIERDGNDLVFAPNFILPRILRWSRPPLCSVVHDLAMERFPWTLHEETRRALGREFGRTLRRSRAVISPSRAIRDELVASGRVDAEHAHAIHHGPGQRVARTPAGDPEPASGPAAGAAFALHVGTLEPRKNLATLVAAWQALHDRGEIPARLVLCGGRGWKNEQLLAAIERGQEQGWLDWPGYVDDEELSRLYRQASLVVSASLYEGFGLPLVEAMAAGTPLLVSDIPVYREVAGEAAVFVPCSDVEGWAAQIGRLMADGELRRRLSEAGRRRCAEFDWQRTAERHLAVWRGLVAEGRS